MSIKLEHKIRRFEQSNCTPEKIKKIAAFLFNIRNSGINPETIQAIQTKRLQETIRHAYKHSAFYQALFKRCGLSPADIKSVADLQKLPCTTANDIRDWQGFLCTPREKVSAVFTTSGTTGEPKRIFYSFKDLQILTNICAVSLRVLFPGPITGLIALPLNHGLWIGSSSIERAVERAGGLPLPVGATDPEETLKWMQRFRPNIIFSSPSYMSVLTRQAEKINYRLKLDLIVMAGELLTSEQKDRFNHYWGAPIINIYGSTEIGSSQTIPLPECTAFHFNDLYLVTEIINPETGEPDDEGELVFTTLRREAMPLIRYKSGDRGHWCECRCGLPLKGICLSGRTDDMIVVGDMNLYGHIITDAVKKVQGTTGRIEILLRKNGLTDEMVLSVEGENVNISRIKQALFDVYPELAANTTNGNLRLLIEIKELSNQMKDLKILDNRNINRNSFDFWL